MIRYLTVMRLRIRRWWLLAQIENVEEQAVSFAQQRIVLYAALRRTNTAIAMRESPANLLTQALRARKAEVK